jgi:hypothetical protein
MCRSCLREILEYRDCPAETPEAMAFTSWLGVEEFGEDFFRGPDAAAVNWPALWYYCDVSIVRVAGSALPLVSPWCGFEDGAAFTTFDRAVCSLGLKQFVRDACDVRDPGPGGDEWCRYILVRERSDGSLARLGLDEDVCDDGWEDGSWDGPGPANAG